MGVSRVDDILAPRPMSQEAIADLVRRAWLADPDGYRAELGRRTRARWDSYRAAGKERS